ncbi:MAG: DUF2605 family protein [Cyanobacteria bacterium J06641_2]
MLKTVLQPLLEDFEYWFACSRTLIFLTFKATSL